MKKFIQKRKKREARKATSVAPVPQKGSTSEVAALQEKTENRRVTHSGISKREPERRGEERVSPMRYLHIGAQFLREARMELKKVKWPTRKELLASTAVVIVLVLIVSLFLGLIDFGLIKILKIIVG